MTHGKAKSVFLDANVLISAGKPPGGKIVERVRHLVEAGIVDIWATDHTIREVAKRHAANDLQAVKDLSKPHVAAIMSFVTGLDVPAVSQEEMADKLRGKYLADTEKMLSSLAATILPIDDINPSTILTAYSESRGLFAAGKKDQFPDAFIFARLLKEVSADRPLIIVSNDGDFVGPSDAEPHVTHLASIEELFGALGLLMETPDIDGFLKEQEARIVGLVDNEVANWGLSSDDVVDADIHHTEVSKITLSDLAVLAPVEAEREMLVIGRVMVTTMASWSAPDWDSSIYDKEDQRSYVFGSTEGETEVEFSVDFTMTILTDEKGLPEEVDTLSFRSEDPLYVSVDPPEDYR